VADRNELLEIAQDAARRAGALLLERFAEPARGVSSKSTSTDLVSDADRDAERLLVDIINKARPEDGLLGEEGAGGESRSGLRWVVDPLDGTVNFLFRIPIWSVSVAVQDDEGSLVGVVHDPSHDEMFWAARGEGARRDAEPIHVSSKDDLADALIGTGFAYDPEIRAVQAGVVNRLLPVVRDIRRLGSAALDMCQVACGRYDGFYESDMYPWDRAAGELIAREAGATVTDLSPPKGDGLGVVSANAALHDKLRALVVG
jgi:myo-inositol-1(or 4)-monophosphatase